MSLMQGTTVLKRLWDYLRGASVSTFVCAGRLYTGNELEKCLILVFSLFSHLSLQCLYESGLVYNDTFVLNVD